MPWYDKFNIFKKPTPAYEPIVVEVGKLSTQRVSSETSSIDPNMQIKRDNRGFHMQDLDTYRYLDADQLLKQLSKMDPDVSAGIWNFLRLLDSGFSSTAIDKNIVPSDKLHQESNHLIYSLLT